MIEGPINQRNIILNMYISKKLRFQTLKQTLSELKEKMDKSNLNTTETQETGEKIPFSFYEANITW